MVARFRVAAGFCGLLALLAPHASAEDAWVRDGASLKLREGAGPGKPVIGSVAAGERLEVLGTLTGWARVRRQDGSVGWISAGYLVNQAPPTAHIALLEAEAAQLREALAAAQRESEALRERADAGAKASAEPEAKVTPPPDAGRTLRGDTRWLDYLVGALILSTGMALGAMLRGVSGRRRGSRLRL